MVSAYLDFVGPDNAEKDGQELANTTSVRTSSAQEYDPRLTQAPAKDSNLDQPAMSDLDSFDPNTVINPDATAKLAVSIESPPVVEARVKFFVVPPPPSRLSHDSSGVISTAEESSCHPSSTCNSTSVETEALHAPQDISLKECSHRFTEPDNDWGFRELIGTSRAKTYLDDEGSLTLRAHVIVYWEAYTKVKDKVMQACSSHSCIWLDIITLVQKHGDMAANAPTRFGLGHHNDSASLFQAACKVGNKDYAAFLLARGAVITNEDDSSRTSLFYAARGGHLHIVRWLTDELGIPVNARDSDNRTAVFYASEEGKIDVVAELISKGADVSVADFEGETPARLARNNGHHNVAALLYSTLLSPQMP